MTILLHTSKTMRPAEKTNAESKQPALLSKTDELSTYLKTLSPSQIQKTMKVSTKLAIATHNLIQDFTTSPNCQRPAVDSFLGDIYSGLQVTQWTNQDRAYANKHLRILSGLYGILRPLDGVFPYRLEMGYKLPDSRYRNLYEFWGNAIAATLPSTGPIINLAAVEYSKTVTPFVDSNRIITPKFLTINPKNSEPTFVVIHAKIARGAIASWLIKNRVDKTADLVGFNELGYKYSKSSSTPESPVFVCEQFEGLGLSVRLT